MKEYCSLAGGIITALFIAWAAVRLPAQPSRPVTEQIYCTGTAVPGSLFAYISQAPGTGTTPVGLQPFRCLQLDPAAFAINAAGQLTIKQQTGFAGLSCEPPGTTGPFGAGVLLYAQDPRVPAEKSCLPIIAIPPAGSIATMIQATQDTTEVADQPRQLIQVQYVEVRPVQP